MLRTPRSMFDLLRILRLKVPGIAHRRVAIADMQLVRARDDAFGNRMAVADHDVITGHIELLDGHRHERQEPPVEVLNEGHLLQEGRVDLPAAEASAMLLRQAVDQRIEVGVRKLRQHDLEHFLGASIGREPLVYECDFMVFSPLFEALRGRALFASASTTDPMTFSCRYCVDLPKSHEDVYAAS